MIFINKILIVTIIIITFMLFNKYLCENQIDYFTNNKEEYVLPKRIYAYWNNLEGSHLINSFIKNWKKKINPEWEIIIITEDTLKNYVSEEFIKKYKHLPTFRFADFLRLELLLNNGGVWMDVSTILIDGAFLDDYYNEMINNKYDACVFELKKMLTKQNNTYHPYLENWFIIAPKNSIYIKDLYNEFSKAEKMGFLNYKQNILLPTGINFSKIFDHEENTYLMQHAIVVYLLHKNHVYHLSIKNGENDFLKILALHNFDNTKTAEYIMNNDLSNQNAIKLTKGCRENIKDVNKFIKRIESL